MGFDALWENIHLGVVEQPECSKKMLDQPTGWLPQRQPFFFLWALFTNFAPLMEYTPRSIEKKWLQWWKDNKTYQVANNNEKPKYYILDMFPYPSGAGLHVGHPLGYIASDIVARFKRLKGYNVLHPMGYDSFGLPAEQYAIQTGVHPSASTEKNITRYREQLENLALSFDWSREVRTSDPSYYKWTQWIFMQLFNHYFDKTADKALPISHLEAQFAKSGSKTVQAVRDEDTPEFSADEWNAMPHEAQQALLLKYRLTCPEESFVNWCPGLGSVLSNDEIKDGVSERGGFPVERKRMKQWSMRITAYCDRLIDGLDTIDWPESIKEQQRNWIGRSQGASVRFAVDGHEGLLIEVFTTRVDTIYGVSFMVLAPEHEMVADITTSQHKNEIESYIRWAGSRTDVERMQEGKKVSGAFTGAYAINPFNNEKVPIYIADYVLAGYGTGAVMGVPSGDQRDWNFATHFKLPIIPILDAQTGMETAADDTKEGRYINSGIINGMDYASATRTLIEWLEARQLGAGKVQYKLRNAIFSRQRYWGEPVPVYWKNDLPYLIEEKDLPLVLPQVDKYLPTETGEPPLGRAEYWYYTAPDGNKYEYELNTMPGWAGSSWYFYRYMDPNNDGTFAGKEALQYWKQVDFYIGGSEHAVGHLLYSRFWNQFMHDLGLVPEREFAQKLVNQGMIQGRSNFVFRAKERFFEEYLWIKVLQPLLADAEPMQIDEPGFEEEMHYDFAFGTNDLVIEVTSYKQEEKIERIRQAAAADGKRLLVLSTEAISDHVNQPQVIADHIRNALNSRDAFIMDSATPKSAALYVSHNLTHKYSHEAFSQLHVDVNIVENDVLDIGRTTGIMMFANASFKLDAEGKFTCSHEVEKMSKAKFNVVNPDDIIDRYGSDCYRLYEMFIGPIEVAKPWNTNGISGVSGFLRKFYDLFYGPTAWQVTDAEPTKEELRHLHTAIKKVTEDIERFSLNTCVSHFMILTNALRDLKCSKRAILEPTVVLLVPFAPHLAEELWHELGHTTSVCDAEWPALNEAHLATDSVVYPVQINGKHRGNIEIPVGMPNAEIEQLVMSQEFVQRNINGAAVKKFIVVPNRIVNIVV
jgi:leucyl-tRNA synthetase